MRERKLSKRDLKYIAQQLQSSQSETATTLAIQPKRMVNPFRWMALAKTWFIALSVCVILAIILFFVWHIQASKQATLKSGTAVLSIQKLATLATAQEQVKTILSKEDNKLFGKNISFNLPGTKRTVFLVVPATVTAGVDLQHVSKNDVAIDEKNKSIQITLPHATILEDPAVDFKNVQTYSSEGIFRNDVKADEEVQLEDLASQKIKKEAIQSGILTIAETNAQTTLQDFFKNLGYQVKINYK
ncbi:DUF4230 domain-containing protein [Pullulanibacillus sp. KACC 23026]|uniref:DUF4230 domain-containing protein n=1 Tax=Pullulanibacillus sp. KACC 23026 TaxID=3028315 RepID=UPI0023B19CFA|nr:DUF4230 domain-containing protein [Pullulanibacillus sp. KACC 23026]WEG14770.1 DUF4230 domain-containing protein [Pullulanibacillus sp. KACC 23026]